MEKEIINPSSLARPVGFSHGIAVTVGRRLFLAGQAGSDAEGRIIAPENIVAQYQQIIRNFQVVVEAAGAKMQDITKLNIFMRDRDDYLAHLKQLGQAHRSFFGAYYPAMALFEISRFFQDEALIEIEGLAVI